MCAERAREIKRDRGRGSVFPLIFLGNGRGRGVSKREGVEEIVSRKGDIQKDIYVYMYMYI